MSYLRLSEKKMVPTIQHFEFLEFQIVLLDNLLNHHSEATHYESSKDHRTIYLATTLELL